MIILMAELLPMLFRQWEIERYKGFLIDGCRAGLCDWI